MAYTIDLLAELDHVDHHLHPRYAPFVIPRPTPSSYPPTFSPSPRTCSKAKRDSYMGVDVFYWTFLWPGEKLGIFWNVRSDPKGRVGKQD